MSRSIRQRLATVLIVIASLLFQQFALAAYVCTASVPSQTVAMADGCASTASGTASQPIQQPDAICQKHCASDPTSASTQNLLGVPALALPPVIFDLRLSDEPGQATVVTDIAFARWDPPPRLRYCRLLI